MQGVKRRLNWNKTVNRTQAPSPPTKPQTMEQKEVKAKREETEEGEST